MRLRVTARIIPGAGARRPRSLAGVTARFSGRISEVNNKTQTGWPRTDSCQANAELGNCQFGAREPRSVDGPDGMNSHFDSFFAVCCLKGEIFILSR